MRWKLSELAFLPLAAGVLIAGLSMPAAAQSQYGERIYADSFGNLVVHSRSGYKRIVVGKGYMAKELAAYENPSASDDVVYLNDEESIPYECWRPAVLLKGRSYMYGLEDGELPDLPGKWCGGIHERAAPGAAIRRVQP
ncbi:hypothetical protein ABMA32_14290 [Mesorhizobium sp. VNQ89]|uniref:hypothetical protein n=1 Tax=Mesorhizobium quangtriensis TaxID=3157709 RepID=UPI0032B7B337